MCPATQFIDWEMFTHIGSCYLRQRKQNRMRRHASNHYQIWPSLEHYLLVANTPRSMRSDRSLNRQIASSWRYFRTFPPKIECGRTHYWPLKRQEKGCLSMPWSQSPLEHSVQVIFNDAVVICVAFHILGCSAVNPSVSLFEHLRGKTNFSCTTRSHRI